MRCRERGQELQPAYDMWSVGVTWLELILGTPHVFQLSARQRALLHHHLKLEDKSEVGPVSLEVQLVRPRLDAGGGLASWVCGCMCIKSAQGQMVLVVAVPRCPPSGC